MTDKKVLKKIIEGYISDSVQSPEVQIDTLRAENVALRARIAALEAELLAARKVVEAIRKIQSHFGRDIPLMDALAEYDAAKLPAPPEEKEENINYNELYGPGGYYDMGAK